MTNEKRNTAIMDKIERYTQHHRATPDLAQEAIERRIAMNNGKDSAMPDILERLQDEADLCRNDGADDIAQTLDDAINEIEALRQPTQTDDKDSAMPIMKIQSPETFEELFAINADGTVTGDIENASEAAKVFFESFRDLIQRNIRLPTQSDALAPIGTEGKYVFAGLEVSCRVTAHIEGWLEVEFLLDRSSAIIRPSRFIPLQEQSPFAQSIPSLHIHLQKTQINRPSNLHKTQIAKPERPDMTDTFSRQAVVDAIARRLLAVDVLHPIDGMPKSGKRVYGDRTQPKTRIVAVTVTDEMVERAAIAHLPRTT